MENAKIEYLSKIIDLSDELLILLWKYIYKPIFIKYGQQLGPT